MKNSIYLLFFFFLKKIIKNLIFFLTIIHNWFIIIMWLRDTTKERGIIMKKEFDMTTYLNEYAYLEAQLKSVKKAQDELKVTIINTMVETGIDKIDDGEKSLTLTKKQIIKMVNENKVIEFLKQKGFDGLVKEKVDTSSFNQLLVKKNPTLLEGVKNDYEVNNITTLMFKKH